MKQRYTYVLFFALSACFSPTKDNRVFYINSYHAGYKPSDDIRNGIDKVFQGKNIVFKAYYLDSKNLDAVGLQSKVAKVLDEIQAFQPNILLTSDDNAVKHVVVPHFKHADLPILFCGVNWTSDQYGLPNNHIRGMLEILPVTSALDTIKNYVPSAARLGILSENSTSERQNKARLQPLIGEQGWKVEYHLVDDFSHWKASFKHLNDHSDAIFLPTNGAIKGWDTDSARALVRRHTKVPIFTCDDFMMDYAVFGLTKVASEQGEWIARKALDVLNGKNIEEIEMARNLAFDAWINPTLAEKINFKPKDLSTFTPYPDSAN